jgi:23S rRNA (cytosine1962-C5)-methyltransferase
MIILQTTGWEDYALIDSGDGNRLERFGDIILVRPDPQVIWKPKLALSEWNKADAIFERTSAEKGQWKSNKKLLEKWQMQYKTIKWWCKLALFKHTGVFPEQVLQWDWISSVILNAVKNPSPNILNLFGYTGIASLVAAEAGAKVTHIDASYPTIGWGRDNQKLSGLEQKPIRWILDDAIKFCEREVRRGVKYDGILMDPPIFGHGPNGETWEFNKSFPKLMEVCSQLLSDKPLFFLVNAYAISASAIMLENVLRDYIKVPGEFESGELVLVEKSGRQLSTGIFARWSGLTV